MKIQSERTSCIKRFKFKKKSKQTKRTKRKKMRKNSKPVNLNGSV